MRHEAAPDADQAAAVRGHRHAAAGRGAARAHGLVHGPGRGRGGGGDARDRARERVPREVRRRPRRRRPRGARGLRGADRVEAAAALVFIGFMGAGKSLAARSAAAALNVPSVDSDALLERRLGVSIESYFAPPGEHAFRAEEEEAVTEILEAPPAPVVSLGGGAIASERVREALARHTVVLLAVDAGPACPRCRNSRPLARDRDRFDALHAERAPVYARLADAILPADRRDEVRQALPAIRARDEAPSGTKLLWAGAYPVFVGEGVLGAGMWPQPGRRFLVTDETVGDLYADRLPAVARDIRIPPGERHKTMETAHTVLRALASAGMDRD